MQQQNSNRQDDRPEKPISPNTSTARSLEEHRRKGDELAQQLVENLKRNLRLQELEDQKRRKPDDSPNNPTSPTTSSADSPEDHEQRSQELTDRLVENLNRNALKEAEEDRIAEERLLRGR